MDVEQLRDITRQRWGRITAFRLGQVAAEYLGPAAASANPYRPDQHASMNYLLGIGCYEAKTAKPTTKEST